MGAIRFFIIFIFLSSISPFAVAADMAFEAEFKAVSDDVSSRLIEAPEASFIYLNHWIDVYNEAALEMGKPSFDKRPHRVDSPNNFYRAPDIVTAWQPNGRPIVSPNWALSTPISLSGASQFRPPPPPKVGSPEFDRDIEEVFRIGEKYGEYRPTDGAVMGVFWADGIGTITPPGRWNLIALEQSRDWPDYQRARLMLLLNIALYDAGIAAWDSKYHYKYWRPTNAITKLYPEHVDWEPMMEPPFHPEYVSGHSTFSAAGAGILQSLIGPTEFCVISDELLGLTRCFSSFTEAAQEAGKSRIYGGIHYEFSNQAGQVMGLKVASQVLRKFSD